MRLHSRRNVGRAEHPAAKSQKTSYLARAINQTLIFQVARSSDCWYFGGRDFYFGRVRWTCSSQLPLNCDVYDHDHGHRKVSSLGFVTSSIRETEVFLEFSKIMDGERRQYWYCGRGLYTYGWLGAFSTANFQADTQTACICDRTYSCKEGWGFESQRGPWAEIDHQYHRQ